MKIAGIIPARFASTRFPGKPLTLIHGKPMILHVAERVSMSQALSDVIVATDNPDILNIVQNAGFKAVLTRDNHPSGTDRCAEAMNYLSDVEAVINIQGDEPFIQQEHIQLVADLLKNGADIATLVKPIQDLILKNNPNIVKAVINSSKEAMYFSRSSIPYNPNDGHFLKHIGIYGFKAAILKKITQLAPSNLEIQERLEQLRWLENGYTIKVDFTDSESHSIDTPEDLHKI